MAHKRARTKGKAKIEMKGHTRFLSRAFKRMQRKTPGGRTVVHYNYKKHSKHLCAICHGVLHGKPRVRAAEMKHLGKSERKPERPFGGMLCSECSRHILMYRAKIKYNVISKDDVPISLRGYVICQKV